ncbi:hypothetical protein WKH56_20125 [Priestia sp. SB1]|uniref:hypothetical protein n=1 Tax=Priestia sp. SB1 TaxID=3132359 RepID=UPI00316FE100
MDQDKMDAFKHELNRMRENDEIPSSKIKIEFKLDSPEFKESMEKLKQLHEKLAKQPIAIKANQEWFDEQVVNEVIIVDKNYKGMNKQLALFTGLPFTIDNTVDTYKFVYREEE